MKSKAGRMERLFNDAIKKSGFVQYGTSKKEAVREARKDLANQGKSVTAHSVAKEIGFHSKGSYQNAYATIRDFARFLDNNGVKKLEEFGGRRVESFLRGKVEEGVKYETYQNICSHLTKMEGIMKSVFEDRRIERNLAFIDRAKDHVREYAKEHLEKGVEARYYENPNVIIESLTREDHQLVASIQLESGARINEASLIDEKRLGGIDEDRGCGVIYLQPGDAKGGLERDLYIPKETYERLEKYVAEHGKLHVPKGGERQIYRDAIKAAAESTGQNYTGSHGLRHNFAQNRMEQLQADGVAYRIALTQVSVEMGHFREDITLHYLRT